MEFVSINKLSLLDYPEKVSCIIFTPSCNFCCPYCHNWKTLIEGDLPYIPFEDILSFLKKRIGILDGAVISGGEPTLMSDLPDKIRKIRELGFLVKLDTNGSNPEMLQKLINENLVNYVAMDIKHDLDKYQDIIHNPSIDLSKVQKSIEILKQNKVDYEFRTTLIREHHDVDSIYKIGKLLEGAKRLYLQKFLISDGVQDKSLHEVSEDVANRYVNILGEYIELVDLRGY